MALSTALYSDPKTFPNGSPYVRLTKSTVTGTGPASLDLYFPYIDDIGFSITNQLFQPVKAFFEGAQESMKKAAGTGAISSVFSAITTASDTLGQKMYNKYYMASAWKESLPANFSITLKLQFGQMNAWDGNTEVFSPIMTLMSACVPSEIAVGNLLTAPATNAFSAFSAFGESYFKTATRSSDTVSSTWTVAFGANNSFPDFLHLKNYLAETANFKFSNKLDSKGYPISGEISITFKSQTIATSADFTSNYLST